MAERMQADLLSVVAGPIAGKSFSPQSHTRLLQLLNARLADYGDAIAAAVGEHLGAPIFPMPVPFGPA
jgi:hypothetical protein